VIIRGLIVLTGLVLNNMGLLSPDPAVQGPFNVLVVSVGALDLLLLLVLGLGRVPPIWLSQLMALVDTIGLMLVVVASGGISSPYFVIGFLILLIAAMRAGPVLTLASGGLMVLGYGALALPVMSDLLTGGVDPDLVRLVVTRWSTLFLATIFAVLFARQQQTQRRQRAAAQSRSETLIVLLSTNQALDSPTDIHIHTVLHTIAAPMADHAVQALMALGAKSQAIRQIVTAIQRFAARTNLLALNAAIEAARGFAEMADEVRHLVESSRRSDGDVASLSEEIIGGTEALIRSIDEVTAAVARTAAVAKE
jgi:hypothetical protein